MGYLIKRNMKLFFKDKGMLISSLITPIILLVLYITFLGRVYKDIFIQNFPESFEIDDKLINGFVSSQLFSSLFAVSCITISFCNNLIMIQDKVTGANNDFITSPVRKPLIMLNNTAANTVDQKFPVAKPSIKKSTIFNIAAFTTNVKRPNVKKLIGKERSIQTGLITALIIPNNKAATKAAPAPSK